MEAGTTEVEEARGTGEVLALGTGEHPTLPEAHPGPSHPSPARYVGVALILAVLTSIEVGLYYIKMAPGPMVATLLALATLKFVMVAAWFMHLRFDSRILRRLFVTGILLALTVFTVVLLSFHVLIGK